MARGAENDNDNVGFVKNGGTASYSFINTEAGVYNMTLDLLVYNAGKINIVVLDENSRERRCKHGLYHLEKNNDYTPTTILLPGKMEPGSKKDHIHILR